MSSAENGKPAGRFFDKIIALDDEQGGCWQWQGRIEENGYGRFHVEYREGRRIQVVAHRYAYEFFVGEIPEGLELDHLCRVTLCVNPAHLEPVTHQENMRRGARGVLKTHCDSGRHPRIPENLTPIRSDGSRTCRLCRSERARAAARIPGPRRTPPARCVNGHPYDDANTYYTIAGWFKCRACRAAGMRKKAS